ncbi:MAG: lipocalin family protein [bacterium]
MKSKCLTAVCACVVGATIFFSGCGSSDDSGSGASIVGTWTWNSATINGISVNMANPSASTTGGSTVVTPASLAALVATQGIAVNSLTVTLTFSDNGSVSGTLSATAPGQAPQSQSIVGSYVISGSELTLTASYNGQTVTGTGSYDVSSSSLTVNLSNAQILQILNANGAAVASLPAEAQAIMNGLSGSISFSR